MIKKKSGEFKCGKDIARIVADDFDLTIEEAAKIVKCVMASLHDMLVSGEEVKIWQFGVFDIRLRKGHWRLNKNFKNVCLWVPEKYYIFFKPTKVFEERINRIRKSLQEVENENKSK